MYIKQSGTVKWFGHEPFQNGDHGDYIYVCKICYYHDIVEELKNNNHYYVSHAITFHIVLSKERWTFFYLLTSLDIAEYECHINCLTIETSRRMHLAGHDIITLMRTEFIVVFLWGSCFWICHIMHLFIHNHPNTSETFYDLLLFQFTQVWRDVARDSIFV